MAQTGYEQVSIYADKLRSNATEIYLNNSSEIDDSQLVILLESDWFWGTISKEESAFKFKDKKDGYFLVRNSTNGGEYTLTIRKHGANRLVRILFKRGKYGLNEPLRFSSVVELIEYYRKHSLAEFNSKLDVKLKYPISRLSSNINKDNIYSRLNDIQSEIKCKNDLFKVIEREFSSTKIGYNELCLLFSSQLLLTDLLKEHQHCMKTFIKSGVYPELLIDNKEIFDTLFLSEKEYLSQLENKLDLLKKRGTEYEIKISMLRSELNSLFNQSEEYTSWLIENGASFEELESKISKFNLDEEIYGGTIEALNLLRSSKVQHNELDFSQLSNKSGFPIQSWLSNDELSRVGAQQIFNERGKADGSFIVRPSKNNLSHVYTLEVMFKSKLYRIKIFNSMGLYQLEKGPSFPNLEVLIHHYSISSLKNYKQILDTTLKFPIL